jgi:WhiB family redox-sensing transcriptional regulator
MRLTIERESFPGHGRGLCRGLPHLFFSDAEQAVIKAKNICAECPVREACREFGLTQEFGLWGGETEQERRAARKALGINLRALRS